MAQMRTNLNKIITFNNSFCKNIPTRNFKSRGYHKSKENDKAQSLLFPLRNNNNNSNQSLKYSWEDVSSLNLLYLNDDVMKEFDLVIAGAGPAGISVAERVAFEGFQVCVVDPNPLGEWPNNYGVWVDEFELMGLEDCLNKVWSKAIVYLDKETEKL